MYTPPLLNFRAITLEDLDQVDLIEQRSATYPWRKSYFTDSIESGHLCILVEQNDQPVGHCVMMTVAGEASILILTIDKGKQRKGIGKQLLQHMILLAAKSSCDTILLEVRKSNYKAFNLYLQEGFSEIGIRKNYYPTSNGHEDAVVMAMEPSRNL